MGTMTILILYRHTGELEHTPKTPVAVWQEGMVDLSETVDVLYSSDDFRTYPIPKWEVREVRLPGWLPPEEWLADAYRWQWLWNNLRAAGIDPAVYPESRQRGLMEVTRLEGFQAALRLIDLLATKDPRSSFRASLKAQVEAWLDTPPEQRRYPSPLSKRQWECLGPCRRRSLPVREEDGLGQG